MEKKFAFLLMGEKYDPERHHASFQTAKSTTYIFTVRDYEEAKAKIAALKEDGFGAIELCGAFGRERALELTALTDDKVAIGYIVHEPEQDALFSAFFS